MVKQVGFCHAWNEAMYNDKNKKTLKKPLFKPLFKGFLIC
nr:MAG TPA: hypothetical protein [Bacteriophage sp.]